MKLHPNHAGVQENTTATLRILALNGELLKLLAHSPRVSSALFHTQLPTNNKLKNWDLSSELTG
jgi:hypothetical protein